MKWTDKKIDNIKHVDGITILSWHDKLTCAAANCFSIGDYT